MFFYIFISGIQTYHQSANLLDPDKVRQNVGPDLGPNHARIKEFSSGGGGGSRSV